MKKVLFLAGGLPHYFIPVLNKLNSLDDYEIEIVIAEKKSETIGKAVHQNIIGNTFKVHFLNEEKKWYGKPFYIDLIDKLEEIKPNAIFVVWPYSLAFIFNFKLKRYIKRNGIKIVNRDIPFQVPIYSKTFEYYSKTPPLDENLDVITSVDGIKNKLYVFLLKHIRKTLYNRFDAHALYANSGKEVIESYGVNSSKIFVLGNTIDTAPLLKLNEKIEHEKPILEDNPYRLIHVGRLVKWKKVDLLLRSVAQLKLEFPKVECIIVGNGPEQNNLIQLVADLNIKENVIFTGGIYDEEQLGKYTKAASIYVLAGMGGLSINEAMCFAKPVIISVCDGTEDVLVKNNENGFYFKEDDVNDLSAKIATLFRDKELCKTFGDKSLEIIKNDMNIDVVINNYKKIFQYLFENSN